MARHDREASLHSCGRPVDLCSDPTKKWFPQRTVCYPTMEREAAAAKYARIHHDRPWHDGRFRNWSPEPTLLTPYRYDMGVTVWVAQADHNPDDDFLSSESPGLRQHEEDEPDGDGES